MPVYPYIAEQHRKGRKLFAVLIDPDDIESAGIDSVVKLAEESGVDLFFVGGSLVTGNSMHDTIVKLKAASKIPVIIFPGSIQQVDKAADALLFLSLISGRNPELLIGSQVQAAPFIKRSGIEAISTGYMLIDGGAPTTVSYISNTLPIPADKKSIAVSTALAGELLGMKLIYMDAGSGAKNAIPVDMIQSVAKETTLPLIVGGGIRQPEQAYERASAGASIIVVGNAIETNAALITEMSFAIHSASKESARL